MRSEGERWANLESHCVDLELRLTEWQRRCDLLSAESDQLRGEKDDLRQENARLSEQLRAGRDDVRGLSQEAGTLRDILQEALARISAYERAGVKIERPQVNEIVPGSNMVTPGTRWCPRCGGFTAPDGFCNACTG